MQAFEGYVAETMGKLMKKVADLDDVRSVMATLREVSQRNLMALLHDIVSGILRLRTQLQCWSHGIHI